MIRFRTLGALDLRRPDGQVLHALLAQPKRIAVLAYLCVAQPRGFHRRDTLLGLLWPEVDQSHARTSLRNALYVLRNALGEAAVQSRGDEEVAVNPELVWCDAVAFEESLDSRQTEKALELYRGDFLNGFFLDDVPTFEKWLDNERMRLRRSAGHAAGMAAQQCDKERNPTQALVWARRGLDLADNDEREVRRLLDLLARLGDRAGALQFYEEFARRVATEFEAEPSDETRALIERIRHQTVYAESTSAPESSRVAHDTSDQLPDSYPISDYELREELGRGAVATVFRAFDVRHAREVALKIMRPNAIQSLGPARFLAEISIAAGFRHPNIVPLLDSGVIDGRPFYVMPFVEGETLRDRLSRERRMPVDDAVRLTCQVADALHYVHTKGFIHRDVKPENILLENDQALLTDFGIGLFVSDESATRQTEAGVALGTASYMSPEQAVSNEILDPRVDIYALATVLYEMLAGDPPFTGSNPQTILSRRAAEPAPPLRTIREAIPPALERTILKALSRAPADRYTTAKDFADAVRISAAAEPPVKKIWLSRKNFAVSSLIASGVAITAIILVAVGGWKGIRLRGSGDERLKSVAVLPCENVSTDPSQAFVGDQWTDELISKLFKIGDLHPKSSQSVNRFKTSPASARKIGSELNVGSFVRCRVAEGQNGVKLEIQLVRSDEDRVILSNEYEEPAGIEGVNAAQTAAALDIARMLNAEISQPSMIAVSHPLTRDSAALRLYRLGRHFYNKGGVQDLPRSIQYFNAAIRRDSLFARAYVGLADATALEADRTLRIAQESQPETERYLRKAISLDPTIPEAHSLLAYYYSDYAYDSISAEQEHRRAIELSPSSSEAHLWYGLHRFVMEDMDSAIAEFQRAVDLDPTLPMPHGHLARALLFAGRRDLAMQHLRMAMDLYPEWPMWPHLIAIDLIRRGKTDSAVSVLNRAQKSAWNGWLYGLAGRSDTAQRILDSLMVESRSRPVDPVGIAVLHIGMGHRQEAVTWLERGYAERSGELRFFIGVHPAFRELRNEPRFRALRRHVGFAR